MNLQNFTKHVVMHLMRNIIKLLLVFINNAVTLFIFPLILQVLRNLVLSIFNK